MSWRSRKVIPVDPVGTKGFAMVLDLLEVLERLVLECARSGLSHVETIANSKPFTPPLIHALASLPPFTAPSPGLSSVAAFTYLFIRASGHPARHSRRLFIRRCQFIRGFLYDRHHTPNPSALDIQQRHLPRTGVGNGGSIPSTVTVSTAWPRQKPS